MSHITVVISATSPNSQPSAAMAGVIPAAPYVPPPYSVNVNYVPTDSMTPAQIGNEIARITRHVNQILGTPAD